MRLAYLPSPPTGQARGGGKHSVVDVAIWAVPFGIVGGRLYRAAAPQGDGIRSETGGGLRDADLTSVARRSCDVASTTPA